MKALYYIGPNSMEVRDIPLPERSGQEYLIKVMSCSICGSDFEGYKGKTGRRTAPMIMGHEFSGIIAEAPENAKYPVGTKCVIFPKKFCGTCEFCKKGLVNVCPNGLCLGVLDQNGAMCEYILTDEKYILPFSKMSFDTASLVEPFSVAYRGVNKISDEELKNAKFISVIGCGPIGLLVITALKYRGFKNIIACDACDFRLDLAKKMGAEFTINSRTENFSEKIYEYTDGGKCDYSIEAVGIAPTANSAVDSLKIGGRSIWIGNAQAEITINMQKIVTSEISISGNYVYGYEDFTKCLEILVNGVVNIDCLITGKFDLADGVQAFKDLEDNREGKKIKTVLTCGKE